MRFMLFVKATTDSEAGVLPSDQLIAAMMQYNEALVKAGVLVDGGGLLPSSTGVRVTWERQNKRVIDGPFDLAGMVSGFWLIEVKSREEALEWAMRCPDPSGSGKGAIELRQLSEAEDLTENEELIQREAADQMVERLRSMGLEVEYLVFDDEGHGFTKRVNQLKGYGAMADFLIRHLVG